MTFVLPEWLNYTGYLTEKLRDATGDATLEVYRESWLPDTAEELILCREVIIASYNTPMWYARTIVPLSTYNAHPALFARLQHESLGSLIFVDKLIQRLSIEPYAISATDTEYQWLQPDWHQNADQLWMRVSTLSVTTHVFYLTEIFLPGLYSRV